jgi:YtkA-like
MKVRREYGTDGNNGTNGTSSDLPSVPFIPYVPYSLFRSWLALAICAGLLLTGCRKAVEQAPDVVIRHEVAPQPPRIGPATITIGLADAAGRPIPGARIDLEGNMSHPGMNPVFGEAREIGPGSYQGLIEFTMGGDWVVIVYVILPGGRKLERQFDVKSVQAG